LSALGLGGADLDIENAHSISSFLEHFGFGHVNFSLRGMEFYHVIVCVTNIDVTKLDITKVQDDNKKH
jgi:hypothetical protein